MRALDEHRLRRLAAETGASPRQILTAAVKNGLRTMEQATRRWKVPDSNRSGKELELIHRIELLRSCSTPAPTP